MTNAGTINKAAVNSQKRMIDAQAFLNRVARWKLLVARAPNALGEDDPLVTATWFAKGCPSHCRKEVLIILARQEYIQDPIIGMDVEAGKWYHRFAYWQRDGGAGEKGDASYTLYRAVGSGEDTFTQAIQNGCNTNTSIQYRWDKSVVETLPAFVQGFDIQIGGLSRDPNSNLFSYYISTVEQLTFHNISAVVADTEFETVTRESWTGLRRTKTAPRDDEGASVDVPSFQDQEAGELISNSWSHNDRFCTWNVTVETNTAKTGVEGRTSCEKTQYRESDSVTTMAEATALGHAAEPVGGVIKSHRSQARPDGLSNNTVGTVTERAVAQATREQTGDLFRTTTRQNDANIVDPGDLDAVQPTPGTISGRSRAKTPGGKARVTNSTTIFNEVLRARVRQSGDLVANQESVTSVNQAAISAEIPGYLGEGLPIKTVSFDKTGADQYNNTVGTDTPGPYREYTISNFVLYTTLQEHTVNFINATGTLLADIAARYPYHHAVPGYSWNRFGLMQGHIRFTPYVGGSAAYDFLDETGFKEAQVATILGDDGIWYERTITSIYDLKRDEGISSGKNEYNGTIGALSGSYFRPMPNDWYMYKRVTSITVVHVAIDVTEELEIP